MTEGERDVRERAEGERGVEWVLSGSIASINIPSMRWPKRQPLRLDEKEEEEEGGGGRGGG